MSSVKLWAVVEFLGTKGVDVVPVSWISRLSDGSLVAKCPPSNSSYSTLVNSYADPDPDWAEFKVRVWREKFG